MLKCLGIAGLWAVLLALPHLGGPTLQVSLAGASPPIAVPTIAAPTIAAPTEDPGDPFRQKEPTRSAVAGSFATVHFKNELDKSLVLVEARVTMDGKDLAPVTALAPGADTVVFAGRVAAGHHTVETKLRCQGNRRGPITYMKKYHWSVRSEEVLTVPEERAVVFTIAARRNKGFNVPFDRQVDIAVRDELVPVAAN